MIKLDVDQKIPNKTLSKFKKKIRDSRIILEMMDREYYVTPSQKKNGKKKKSLHRKKMQDQKKDQGFNDF
jgi:ribosomal protein S21